MFNLPTYHRKYSTVVKKIFPIYTLHMYLQLQSIPPGTSHSHMNLQMQSVPPGTMYCKVFHLELSISQTLHVPSSLSVNLDEG